jgi:hypothetical protein
MAAGPALVHGRIYALLKAATRWCFLGHQHGLGTWRSMNLAVGIGAGLAMGMGGGIIGGRKKAIDNLREYARVRHITIDDGEGQPYPSMSLSNRL